MSECLARRGARAGAPWTTPRNAKHCSGSLLTAKGKTRSSTLPIHLKISQAGRQILKAVDLFVALATVKLKGLVSEDVAQL